MNKCKTCAKFLKPQDVAKCSSCSEIYQKKCVGATTEMKDWSCSACSVKNDRSPSDLSGRNLVNSTFQPPPQIYPGDLTDRDVVEMRREMALFMAELREYRQEMLEWRTDVLKRLDGLERRVEVVEKSSSPKVAELEQMVTQLKSELNDRDQEALLADLDVGNLPESTGENTTHTVTVLAAKLGVQLSSADIVFAERVGAVERSPTGDATAAEERRTLSSADLGAPGAPRRVYVNERLTRANRVLFHQAREECRRLQWRYSWTKRGRIYVRQGDGKPVFPIRCDADIERVFNCTNVSQTV